jgi:hypothetical protein
MTRLRGLNAVVQRIKNEVARRSAGLRKSANFP